jgi:hypothetical protein
VAICHPNGKQSNHQYTKHDDRQDPIELFTYTKVVDNPKHWKKAFGHPVHVLNDD